jgi:hypothetical protein
MPTMMSSGNSSQPNFIDTFAARAMIETPAASQITTAMNSRDLSDVGTASAVQTWSHGVS